jgi:catechol 2,3-dioxygenase-like lactoylglutathione lyase family enzyme
MIHGAHVLFYSADAEADRAFFRDVLELPSIDIGHGWMIFKLPPAEAAVHPSSGDGDPPRAERGQLGAHVYLMCEDLQATIASLAAKGVHCSAVETERWGVRTTIPLPSGGAIGLYQPTHPTALDLDRRSPS